MRRIIALLIWSLRTLKANEDYDVTCNKYHLANLAVGIWHTTLCPTFPHTAPLTLCLLLRQIRGRGIQLAQPHFC